MTLPTVKAISEKYGVAVTYGTDLEYLDGALPAAVQHQPYISQVLSFRDVELAYDQFDAVINLTCPCIVHEVPHAPAISRIDLFARHAGVLLKDRHLDYKIMPEEDAEARVTLANLGLNKTVHKLVLINPFSSTQTRHIPAQMLENLCRDLTADPSVKCLIFTHGEEADGNWDTIPGCVELQNVKLRQIAAIMSHCELVVCPDSALLHLAGALDKKTLTFFGPTDPNARINYFPHAVAVWGGAEMTCAPCWYEACKFAYTCWRRFDYAVVQQAAIALVHNTPLPEHPLLVSYPNVQAASDFDVL
tara:strand:- start:13561 stop:14472 length:912 start_codon:yes stop_codon:yes gene_type:complete